jgi:hypothetical protein
MNSDQLQSLIRTVLKVGSGLLLAHGLTDTATVFNSPDVIAAITLIVTVIWSHYAHGANPPPPPPVTPILLLSFMLASGLVATGCKSGPAVTYRAASTSGVAVGTALKAYDVFAAAGKTTPAQNAAVKAAYEKYQAAFALVCDAGAVYSAAGQTNAPAAGAALQIAVQNANQAIADLVTLVQRFGVQIQ